jgi:hypothetical protein
MFARKASPSSATAASQRPVATSSWLFEPKPRQRASWSMAAAHASQGSTSKCTNIDCTTTNAGVTARQSAAAFAVVASAKRVTSLRATAMFKSPSNKPAPRSQNTRLRWMGQKRSETQYGIPDA